MYVYTRSFSKHDEPKSITFTVDLFGCFRRMFSGFKSQWMTFCFRRNFSDVDRQEFERDAQVLAKVEVLVHVHDVRILVALLRVVPQVLQDLHLDQSLGVKPLLVPNHLDGFHRLRLVIETPHDLPEAPFADDLDDLVPVREVIVRDDDQVVPVVVVPVVVRPALPRPSDLLPHPRGGARVPHLRELANLPELVLGQIRRVVPQHRGRRHRDSLLRRVRVRAADADAEAFPPGRGPRGRLPAARRRPARPHGIAPRPRVDALRRVPARRDRAARRHLRRVRRRRPPLGFPRGTRGRGGAERVQRGPERVRKSREGRFPSDRLRAASVDPPGVRAARVRDGGPLHRRARRFRARAVREADASEPARELDRGDAVDLSRALTRGLLLAGGRVGGISRRRRRVRVMRHADAVHGGEVVRLVRHLALSRARGVRSFDAGRARRRARSSRDRVGLRNDAT
eukprot:31303-Pelagococcus_subviridis.AAC.7